MTTFAAGRPGTAATPVSMSAMPTPAPVSDAAVPVSAPMIDRTMLSVVAVPVLLLDSHAPAHPPLPTPAATVAAERPGDGGRRQYDRQRRGGEPPPPSRPIPPDAPHQYPSQCPTGVLVRPVKPP